MLKRFKEVWANNFLFDFLFLDFFLPINLFELRKQGHAAAVVVVDVARRIVVATRHAAIASAIVVATVAIEARLVSAPLI